MDKHSKWYMLIFVALCVALFAVCVFGSVPGPYRRPALAFASPELTPPPRPTPTGWPTAPFSWQTHRVKFELRVIYDPGL